MKTANIHLLLELIPFVGATLTFVSDFGWQFQRRNYFERAREQAVANLEANKPGIKVHDWPFDCFNEALTRRAQSAFLALLALQCFVSALSLTQQTDINRLSEQLTHHKQLVVELAAVPVGELTHWQANAQTTLAPTAAQAASTSPAQGQVITLAILGGLALLSLGMSLQSPQSFAWFSPRPGADDQKQAWRRAFYGRAAVLFFFMAMALVKPDLWSIVTTWLDDFLTDFGHNKHYLFLLVIVPVLAYVATIGIPHYKKKQAQKNSASSSEDDA